MRHEVDEMVFEALAQLLRFALQRFPRQGDVAQYADNRGERLDLRERQHIGGLVDAPPLTVERPLLGVVGENDRELGNARDLGLGPLERRQRGPPGKRLDAVGPALGFDRNGDFERWLQCALSDFSVAPS